MRHIRERCCVCLTGASCSFCISCPYFISATHLLPRCALFEASSATVTLGPQMCPVWGEQCHSYTCYPDVPCLRRAVPQFHLLPRCSLFEASSATHLLPRCALFEASSATVTLATRMCPVWGEQCHSYTCYPDVPCLRRAMPQLHLLPRCALFEASSATVTLATQMCPVWGEQCHSYTCYPDVPCLRRAVPQLHLLPRCARNRLSNMWAVCSSLCPLKWTLPHDL
jgi:hypothetical protein